MAGIGFVGRFPLPSSPPVPPQPCASAAGMARWKDFHVAEFAFSSSLKQDALKMPNSKSKRNHQSFPTGVGTGQSTVENAFWNVGSVRLLVTKGWASWGCRVWPVLWIEACTDLTVLWLIPGDIWRFAKPVATHFSFSKFKFTLQVSKVLQLTSPFCGRCELPVLAFCLPSRLIPGLLR